MEELISGPLAAALAGNRERFNRLYAQAAQRAAHLDPDEMAGLVHGPLRRCVEAVAQVAPERAETAAAQLFESILSLYAAGQLGGQSRNPLPGALWEEVLPQLAPLLAPAPRRLVAPLANAAIRLWQEDRRCAERWLQRLNALAPRFATVEEALDAALVLAWSAGLAHYRQTALDHWQRLPQPLQFSCLEAPEAAGAAALAATMRQRWHPPRLAGKATAARLKAVARLGAFTGFGGPFAEPPLVTGDGETLYAYDGDSVHLISADCFGATLRRVAGVPAGCGTGHAGFRIDATGNVACGTLRAVLAPLAAASSFAATADTLAVTLPHSHAVYLVAPLATEAAA